MYSPMAQWAKNPPAMQETQETGVWFLGLEDPLEKEMATHTSILAWKNPIVKGAWQTTVQSVAKSWPWLITSTSKLYKEWKW